MKRLFASAAYAAALAVLLATAARAASTQTSGNHVATVEGVVVPDSIHDHQPFSFAAPQTVTGEVVSIQTVDGEVVGRAATDKYGRVFLAAGLPAGAYLIAHGTGRNTESLGKIQVLQAHIDPWDWTGTDGWIPIPIDPIFVPPPALKLNDAFTLSGHGFSPNCSDMQVTLVSSGQTQAVPVLAATEDQIKLGPVQQLQPGTAELRVRNQVTGHSAAHDVLLYDIQGNLVRRTVAKGDQTQLIITTQPENQPLEVKVRVVSGPVDFGSGHKEAEAITSKGQAVFPVHADGGAGPFQLTWELVPTLASLSNKDHHGQPSPDVATRNGSGGIRTVSLHSGLDDGTTGSGGDFGGFAGDSKAKDKKDETPTSPDVPAHTKRCEWRFLRVEKTNYTQDDKQLAEDKAKLAKALLEFVDKAAPAAGKATKAALQALSISKANNVYLVYILVEIVDGAETVIDTRIVGPLEDKDAMDFWSDSKADDGIRQNTILRNKPKGGCPPR